MNEFTNSVDNAIKYLESEKQRRINALNSNEHCDNETLKRNIEVLNCGINAMREQRKSDKLKGFA